MAILRIVILVGLLGFTIYQVYTLVKQIKDKNKTKKDNSSINNKKGD